MHKPYSSITSPDMRRNSRPTDLSYKFQRLRERIRKAIVSGELSGRLPGERMLARQFRANAKTLSKALTDLAGEGLLERRIGRGTFVKGSEPRRESSQQRLLLLCDSDGELRPLLHHIQLAHPQSEAVTDTARLRPSFINQFDAVIDLSANTPPAVLRDLVVRNLPLLAVGHEPRTYATPTVLVDRALGASHLGRDLLLDGHRRLAAIEARGHSEIADTLRKLSGGYAPDAIVESGSPEASVQLVEDGITAIVCDGAYSAMHVRRLLESRGVRIPGRLSLSAVGFGLDGEPPCSGYFVAPLHAAQVVLQVLHELPQRQPMALWLVGSFVNRNSTAVDREHHDPSGLAMSTHGPGGEERVGGPPPTPAAAS